MLKLVIIIRCAYDDNELVELIWMSSKRCRLYVGLASIFTTCKCSKRKSVPQRLLPLSSSNRSIPKIV